MYNFNFTPAEPVAGGAELRLEVRAFLKETLNGFGAERRALSWAVACPEFSRKLGARGWIGMTWPGQYGGRGLSSRLRYIVLEELLAVGAPVGAHWIADRQTGPLLLRFGTENQRQRFLPEIARGQLYCCIGMSEPGAGSDLAGIRTTARKVDRGWLINGSKIWTSNAAIAHYMLTLVRTDPAEKRHAGMSQFLIDLKTPGLTQRPISDMNGESHFSEIFFDDVFVSDDSLVGHEGQGWAQVTAELAFERSGPERFLSSVELYFQAINHLGASADEAMMALVGRLTAHLWTLRHMSGSIAAQLESGIDPSLEAALVKDLGAVFEQRIPHEIQALIPQPSSSLDEQEMHRVLGVLLHIAPSFSLRGGTKEILKGVIARGIGLR